MDFRYELSSNWKDHYEGKMSTPDDLYKENVLSTMRYIKLRKINQLMEDNQRDWDKAHSAEELRMLMQTHQHLKNMQMSLMQEVGTVIVK
jgi:DNA primase